MPGDAFIADFGVPGGALAEGGGTGETCLPQADAAGLGTPQTESGGEACAGLPHAGTGPELLCETQGYPCTPPGVAFFRVPGRCIWISSGLP